MTKVERLILKNQYAILEFLTRAHPQVAQRGNTIYHDAEVYGWYQEILEGGYELLMSEITERLDEERLSLDEQVEILDILDMYRDLQNSYEDLKRPSVIDAKRVLFPGWDGNSLKGELWFARVFCYRTSEPLKKDAEPDRFDMVKPSPAHNSHYPTMDTYRRMLAVYKPIREKRLRGAFGPMSVEEIQQVLAAQVHPDNR